MTAAASINRLRSIALRLKERGDVDADWFAACVSEFDSGASHGVTLDHAFGFRLRAGERGWWVGDALERRDELLRGIAGAHFRQLSAREAARQIVRGFTLYEGAGWRLHRQYAAPPSQIDGTVRAGYFALLKIGAPLSISTVRRALAHETPDFVSHEPVSTTDEETTTDGNSTDETTSAA